MWQVANAVRDGLSSFSSEQVQKSKFVAMYTDQPDDNFGLPFWIGKVKELVVGDDTMDGGADASGSNEVLTHVKVAEHIQEKKQGRPTGRYLPYVSTSGSTTQKGRGSKRSSTQIYSTHELSQVCWVFDKLTEGKLVPAKEKNWIAFNCEVAEKTKSVLVVGVEAFNTACGYKTVPMH